MRHLSKKLLMIGITTAFVLMLAIPALALSPNTEIFKTVENASAGCTLVALDGAYIADAQAAVKRINEIRQEACKEGVRNPNTGNPLTENDYVPIQWSSSLEYIARVRAAESSLVVSHTRPNGSSCVTVVAPDGERTRGEALAWNYTSSMIKGINLWYGEKSDWVNKTGGITGHYTAMINPTNLYVGLGCFLYRNGVYYNTTCGEYSAKPGTSSTPMSAIPDCRVIIEIRNEALKNSELVETDSKHKKDGALDKGDTISYSLGIVTELEGDRARVLDAGNVQWTSSDSSVATVNAQGDVLIRGVGTVVIKAMSDSGNSASVTLNPAHTPVTINGTAATCTKTGLTDGEKCSVCGEILKAQQTIPAKGHTVVNDKAVEPTFSTIGLTAGTHCSVCKTVLKAQKKIAKLTAVPKSVKATAKKNKVTVSWRKVTDKKLLKQIKSIQVQYSTKKSFKKATTKTVGKDKTKIRLSLKKKKTFYIRVRFKGVKGNSKWSATKKVKTKK